jgi:hypothetical protein
MMIYAPSTSEKVFKRHVSKAMIASVWLLAPLIMTPSLTRAWGKHGIDCKSRSCTILPFPDGTWNPKYFFLMMGLALPGSVLIVTNFLICKKVRASVASILVRSEIECERAISVSLEA